MQQAIPYRTWPPTTTTTTTLINSQLCDSSNIDSTENNNNSICVTKLVSENAVIVFGKKGCCMCHVVKQLLLGLGVNPTIFLVDEEEEADVIGELSKIVRDVDGDEDNNGKVQFPAVFVGGKWFGGLERVMATHITGELVPLLREARALWL